MFSTPFTPTSAPGRLVHVAHGRNISEREHAKKIAEDLAASSRKSEAAVTDTAQYQSGEGEDEENDPDADLQADGNIYNYSEIHARVTQEAGHWSRICNGNTVAPDLRGGGGGGLLLVLGIVIGTLACELWHLKKT